VDRVPGQGPSRPRGDSHGPRSPAPGQGGTTAPGTDPTGPTSGSQSPGNGSGGGGGQGDGTTPVTGTDTATSAESLPPADGTTVPAPPAASSPLPPATDAPSPAATPQAPVVPDATVAGIPAPARPVVAHRGVGRGSFAAVTVWPTAPVSITDQARRGLSISRAHRHGHSGSAHESAGPGVLSPASSSAGLTGTPAPWTGPVTAPAATQSGLLRATERRASAGAADAPTAHQGGSGGPAPQPQTPFGPPGRGVVGGGSGAPGGAAATGVVCAILTGFLLLAVCPPLRRFRLAPVMAGPEGFISLQQRPG
jgi:hypothetical protein